MKILEIEMENIRGIRNKITLIPNGENVVLHGPNGSGKSGIVDAIDFLFTGDISRLRGRGTSGMSLKEHGPHIDSGLEDSLVKAKVKIEGILEPVNLERRLSKPKDLICTSINNENLNDALDIAQKGQIVLSRAEILKYIAAEAGKRAEEIQAILNLGIVEDIRKAFVSIEKDAQKTLTHDKSNYENSISSINNQLDIKDFSEAKVLEKINEFRKILSGAPLTSLKPEMLQDSISPLSQEEENRVDPERLKRTLSVIDKLIIEKGQEAYLAEHELRQAVKRLNEDVNLKKDLANKRLLDIGIPLIDDTGACPLCLTPWEAGKLKSFLLERLSNAQSAEGVEKKSSPKQTRLIKKFRN